MKIVLSITLFFCWLNNATSQNYHAIHGSSYAGSLGVMNNPASILTSDLAWDINLMSFQVASSTNTVTVLNYSLLSSPAGSLYRINKGEFERYAKANYNFHLLNARVALNQKSSIAFGVNLRGYIDAETNRYNFVDTIKNLRNFLKANESNTDLRAKVKASNFLEVFGTYSHTLWDDEQSRLNGGITLKASRGLAGAVVNLGGTYFTRAIQNEKPFYFVNAGSLSYGYSANIDKWQKGQSASQNISDMIISGEGGVSMDVGLEYMVKPQFVTNYYDDDPYYDYTWKVGISLLDLGVNKYKYSTQSRVAANPKVNLSDTTLQRKFNKIGTIQSFNDSLASIFTGIQPQGGYFTIINPARLVVNVDRNLGNDFYVNAEVSANLSSLAGPNKLYSTEISLLTLTPRWETRRYGLYLPIMLNTENELWVGGAFKAGPVLFGVHNLAYIFSKQKMQSGGGYLALVLRPRSKVRGYRDPRNDCPR